MSTKNWKRKIGDDIFDRAVFRARCRETTLELTEREERVAAAVFRGTASRAEIAEELGDRTSAERAGQLWLVASRKLALRAIRQPVPQMGEGRPEERGRLRARALLRQARGA